MLSLGVFALAFAVDIATDRRWSSVWGGTAIFISVVALFPPARRFLIACASCGGVWLGFNLVRTVADNLGWGSASAHALGRVELRLFGRNGRIPTQVLQSALFDSTHVRAHDLALLAVHASFFVIPAAVAFVLWWRNPGLFVRYTVATALCFGLGVVGFALLPTAPP